MRSATETQRHREGQNRGSLRATLKAIHSFSTDHFPLILPDVHPIAAFFILRRLKRLGYSNCKVQTTAKGLVVHAQR